MADEPRRRQVLVEIAIYVGIVVLAAALFVGLRVAREGTRVLQYDVRPPR